MNPHEPTRQAYNGTESKDLTAFNGHGACLVLFDLKTDSQLAGVEISEAQLKAIKRRAAKTHTAVEDILRYIAKAAMADVDPLEVKIPLGFVMVNLSTREQKEMKESARELGVELRTVLRNAIISAKCELRERVELRRKTGMDWREQFFFFENGARHN